jgi:hypothetical protein
MRRYENLSSIVIEVSVFGLKIHGARLVASAATYCSSADVSSTSRVKWVIKASKVAIFVKRSWLRVFCRTDMRVASLESVAGVLYMVFMIS